MNKSALKRLAAEYKALCYALVDLPKAGPDTLPLNRQPSRWQLRHLWFRP